MERVLRESRHAYEALFNGAPAGVNVVTMDGWFVDGNQRFLDMMGYSLDELRQLTFMDVTPEKWREIEAGIVREFRADREGGRLEKEVIAKDGRVFPVAVSGWVIRDAQGDAVGIVAFVEDITERKRAAADLDAERRQLLSIFDSIDEPVYVVDPDTFEILYVNRCLREALGHDPVGERCHEAFQGLDAPCDFCTNEIILRDKGEPYRWVYRNPKLERDYLLFDRIITWPDGRDVRFELAVDVTERVQAERALKESEERFREVVDDSPIFICRFLTGGVITFVNQAYCDYFGKTEEELVGQSFLQLIPPEDREAVRAHFSSLTPEAPVATYDHRVHGPDGRIRWQRWTDRAIFDGEGRCKAYQSIGQDITGERQLEEQLRQALKMESVGRLAGGVAHDLNNLLLPILGYAELLLQDVSSGDPRHDYLSQIQRAATHAAALIRQLLAFSRKQVLETKTVSLNKVVDGFQPMLRRTIREDIELDVRLVPESGHIKADVAQVEQILINLAVNAQDAMPDGGRLVMETSDVVLDDACADAHGDVASGPHVMLAVTDTGVGMDPETLDRIFEPFFTTKEVGKGTGLGLATVYGIVRQHGGTIRVSSRPGRGATFRLYFPRVDPAAESAPEPPATVDVRGGAETVLVVEDDDAVRALVCDVLGKHGYRVLDASGPDECLRLVEEGDATAHLLLTDVIMPGMNGRELYERLAERLPDLRVVYMSGYDDDAIAHHGILESGVDFIQKPVSVRTLAARVREALDR